MRSKKYVKISRFSASPRSAISMKNKIKLLIRAVGSSCKPAGMLNRSAGSG
jgi:hypothetical protein